MISLPRYFPSATITLRSPAFLFTHTNAGQAKVAMVQAARTAEIGRSNNGKMLPSA